MTKKTTMIKIMTMRKKNSKEKSDNSIMTTVKVWVAVNWIEGAKVSVQRAPATFLSVKAKAQP